MLTQPVYYPPAEFQEYCGLGWRVKRGPRELLPSSILVEQTTSPPGFNCFQDIAWRFCIWVILQSTTTTQWECFWHFSKVRRSCNRICRSGHLLWYLFKATPPPPEVFETYPGTYINVLTGREAVVTAKNDVLFFSRAGTYAYPLGTLRPIMFLQADFRTCPTILYMSPAPTSCLGLQPMTDTTFASPLKTQIRHRNRFPVFEMRRQPASFEKSGTV